MMFYIFPKEAKEFLLAGSVKDKDLVHQNLYPIEFLTTLTSKTLFHKLIFKVIISIILLKNISPIEESYYNTRLIVKKFQQHVIDAEIKVCKWNPEPRNPNWLRSESRFRLTNFL
ncbi:ATP-dependent DNA helicase PIF1-like [Rhizophagus irregularis DAOM 181602=DAOM 197198]|nr:ATP-dependent DNA helicase PIF1-like [Rhizophagus irregularis DAOM 181602=DAOM 197198]CAB4468053.1 unnamed protein product [Rhizophagus irregularis]